MVNMKTIIKLLTIGVLFVSCTVDGSLSDEDKGKLVECVDMRDNEVIVFKSDSIKNIRYGFSAPTTFDVRDTSGTMRTFSSENDGDYKCQDLR